MSSYVIKRLNWRFVEKLSVTALWGRTHCHRQNFPKNTQYLLSFRNKNMNTGSFTSPCPAHPIPRINVLHSVTEMTWDGVPITGIVGMRLPHIYQMLSDLTKLRFYCLDHHRQANARCCLATLKLCLE